MSRDNLNEIIEISFGMEWDNQWRSLPADKSADLMRQFRHLVAQDEQTVTFELELPAYVIITSYTLDFDKRSRRTSTQGSCANFEFSKWSSSE